MKTLLSLAAVALLCSCVPAAAQEAQQSQCAPYEAIAAGLGEKFHEAPVARMLADQGFAIEVLASADGSTFTVLGVQANGTACFLATGQGFAFVTAEGKPTPGTDS